MVKQKWTGAKIIKEAQISEWFQRVGDHHHDDLDRHHPIDHHHHHIDLDHHGPHHSLALLLITLLLVRLVVTDIGQGNALLLLQ